MLRLRASVPVRTFRRCTAATVGVTAAIVVSGGAVRLTSSGLGCPSWPNCAPGQLDAAGFGLRGAIEFGNRLVTVAVTVGVGVTAVLAFRLAERRRDLRLLSLAMVAGVVGNAVIGGITVLTHLHPAWVAVHLLFNMALLAVAVQLHARAGRRAGDRGRAAVRPEVRLLTRALVAVAAFVLAAGTLVTGTGPHGGDPVAPRFRFAPLGRVTALHADTAMLLTGLVLAAWLVTRPPGVPAAARRRARVLAGVVVAQAALGFAQYLLDLPAVLVLVHIAGATLLWLVTLGLALTVREYEVPERLAAPVAQSAVGAVAARVAAA